MPPALGFDLASCFMLHAMKNMHFGKHVWPSKSGSALDSSHHQKRHQQPLMISEPIEHKKMLLHLCVNGSCPKENLGRTHEEQHGGSVRTFCL
jgi:hypothetical protein